MKMTEDQVSSKAASILGFSDPADNISGVGQLTTFNQLGFCGVSDKPDGWYLPANFNEVAIILEVKSSAINITTQKCVAELLKNVRIARRKYRRVVGILYNGEDVLVYKNETRVSSIYDLQRKEYYFTLWDVNRIDKQKIYNITKQINDNLHFNFKVNNLKHRMIFTACALVAQRYGANLLQMKNAGWETFHTHIHSTLAKSFTDAARRNDKLYLLLETFAQIKMHFTEQNKINQFIECIVQISDALNSDYWNGEDVMAIFFNEFTRYKGKSEHGQVFTPDHITSFMYRLIGVGKKDIVLDAACGSGAFLVKAMCNMIKEAGGPATDDAKKIKEQQLYGIENDQEIYALACANMLIHKDGKTNLAFLDSRSEDAAAWIQSKSVTKVLMNPPFEKKYGCIDIVRNVLDHVTPHAICAFIMPDKKLDKENGRKKLLRRHTLREIIKLPENVFSEGVTTSIYVFEAGVQHGDKQIFACYMKEDGLETVKNQGRQDVHGAWPDIEDRWLNIIEKKSGDESVQWINPDEHLSWQAPVQPFEIDEEDFMRTMMDYLMFERGINVKEFKEGVSRRVMYSIDWSAGFNEIPHDPIERIDVMSWREFRIGALFDIKKGTRLTKANMKEGEIPFVGASAMNNGITKYISNSENLHPGNVITVAYNGSVGESFYQNRSFWASDDVNVLYPRSPMNKYIGMFIVPTLRTVGKRYEFIDKWVLETMKNDVIKLPVNGNSPDWEYMDRYMKGVEQMAEQRLEWLSCKNYASISTGVLSQVVASRSKQ